MADNTVKLGDYGLTRQIFKARWRQFEHRIIVCVIPYTFIHLLTLLLVPPHFSTPSQEDYYSRGPNQQAWPIRWMAPEQIVIQGRNILKSMPASMAGNIW